MGLSPGCNNSVLQMMDLKGLVASSTETTLFTSGLMALSACTLGAWHKLTSLQDGAMQGLLKAL